MPLPRPLVAATLAVGCAGLLAQCSTPSRPADGSGDVMGLFDVATDLDVAFEETPRPDQPVWARVTVRAYEPVADVALAVMVQRHGDVAPPMAYHGDGAQTLTSRQIGPLSAGDSVTVRVPVTVGRGQSALRAALTGRLGGSEGRGGVARTLYLLVHDDSFVSDVSMMHARADSVRANRGVLGRALDRLLGRNAMSNMNEGTIETTDSWTTGTRWRPPPR